MEPNAISTVYSPQKTLVSCQCGHFLVKSHLELEQGLGAFLGHLIFLMGMIKVSRCFGLEILILNHPWKNEIRPLEPILG